MTEKEFEGQNLVSEDAYACFLNHMRKDSRTELEKDDESVFPSAHYYLMTTKAEVRSIASAWGFEVEEQELPCFSVHPAIRWTTDEEGRLHGKLRMFGVYTDAKHWGTS